ncbi:MAG TPA: TonB-dependent receptor [Opitutaceae bacterium]|nr:TonB-dependent receptor [Opitutaceae bacterium]
MSMTLQHHPAPGFPVPRRKIASLTLTALLTLASASLAHAQATAVTTVPATAVADAPVRLDEFKVSGLRASAIKALEIKRADPQFTDSIVAEDIGKFPDNNVVESLQRLPGLQVTDYNRGNITGVTVRGLPDVTTTLNGRNIFTASGLSLSLQDVPASLLKRVDVMKTRSAAHIETGMAGVLDIQTFRPFDFGGRKISLAAKATYSEQRDRFDPNISLLLSERWKVGSEGKFGALLNISYLTTHYRDQSATSGAQVVFTNGVQSNFSALPYDRIFGGWTPGLDEGLSSAAGATLPIGAGGSAVQYVLARDAVFFFDGQGETRRPAVNFSMQYAPSDKAEYTFEAFYLGYRNDHYNNLLFSFVDWWNAPAPATLDVSLYPGTNIVKRRGFIGDVFSFTSGDYTTSQTDSMQYSLGGKWFINPSFTLTSELVYQNSEYSQQNFFMRGNRGVRNDVSVDFNAGDGIPSLKYLDVAGTAVNESNITDPATWNLGHAWDQGFKNKGSATTFTQEGILNVDWGWIKRLKFGVRVDDRKASQANRFAEGDPIAGTNLANFNTRFPGIVSANEGFYDGRAAGVPSTWVSISGPTAFGLQSPIRQIYNWQAGSRFSLKETFAIDEVTSAGYLVLDKLETQIAGRRLSGQVGLRFVSIKTSMEFTDPAPASFNKTFGNAGVSKFLPSAAFNYAITDKLNMRLAYGETIRRPGFNDLNPLITYTRDVTNIGYGTASGGNPDLEPTTSKSLDLAFEYYFDEASAVHIALFKRTIDGLVVPSRRRVTYTDAIGPYDYILSQPLNASNGELEGFEVGVKYYPSELPGVFKGFGVEGTYTRLSSSQDVPMTNSAGVVTGIRNTRFFLVSPDSYSGTLAYERGRFSTRASYTWRSAFHHHNEAALFANPLAVYNSAERSLNAQVSFRLRPNLVFTLEGTNLTDDIQHSYYGENGSTVHNFGNWIIGRNISFSTRFSF